MISRSGYAKPMAAALDLISGLFIKNEKVSNAQACLAVFLKSLSPGLPRPAAQRPENDHSCKWGRAVAEGPVALWQRGTSLIRRSGYAKPMDAALDLISGLFIKHEKASNAQACLAVFLSPLSPGLPRPAAQRPENDHSCK